MHEFTCVGVYLGIDIHKITLSTLVGYHIGYLVDLASSLCLSFLFLFSFSFAYEYAKLSKYVCVHRSALLSSHVFFNINKRSFDHRQCRFSSPLFVAENRIPYYELRTRHVCDSNQHDKTSTNASIFRQKRRRISTEAISKSPCIVSCTLEIS